MKKLILLIISFIAFISTAFAQIPEYSPHRTSGNYQVVDDALSVRQLRIPVVTSQSLNGYTALSGQSFSVTSPDSTINVYLGSGWVKFPNLPWVINALATKHSISLTTTGNNGAATYISNILNIPNYTLVGLGAVGTTGYHQKQTATGIGNSEIFENSTGTGLGIGTTTPVASGGGYNYFTINGSTAGGYLAYQYNGTTKGLVGAESSSFGVTASSGARLILGANGVEKATVGTNGFFGIGTASPSNDLSFGNSTDRQVWIENSLTDVAGHNLQVVAGSTVTGTAVNDVNGGNLTLKSGVATGAGTSSIIFQTPAVLASGKVLQSWATRMTILGSGNVDFTKLFSFGGTALTANQVPGVNSAGTAMEGKTISANTATGTTVTNGTGTIVIANDTTKLQTVLNFFPKGDTRWFKSPLLSGLAIGDFISWNGTNWINHAIIASGRLNWNATTSTISLNNQSHTIFTPTTGSTVTLVNNQANIINPSGALVALTLALPASPANNDEVRLTFTQAVTTISYSGGTVVGGLTSISTGGQYYLTYDSGTATWY
jgi:hypothetical protein